MKKMIPIIIILFATTTFSQNSEWRNYLFGNYVHGIAEEDNDLWIATHGGGLVKFNKQTEERTFYNRGNGFPDNILFCVVIDSSGNKLVGTYQAGLAKYNGENWTTYHLNLSEYSDQVRCITIDAEENIWVGSIDGVAKLEGESWVVYDTSNSELPDNSISAINSGDGKIWIGTRGWGLVSFDGENWEIINTSNSELPNNTISSIYIDKFGNKWIGTLQGLAKFNENGWEIFTTSNSGLPHQVVQTIQTDENDHYWIGTNAGLAEFDGENWNVYGAGENGSSSIHIGSLVLDGDIKWIGNNDGLIKFDGTNWTYYDMSNSPMMEVGPTKIFADIKNNIWMSSYGQILKFNDNNWTTYDSEDSDLLNNIGVNSFTQDIHGNLWAATNTGIIYYNGVNWENFDYSGSGLESLYIDDIYIDSKGRLWILARDKMIAVYENNSWKTFNEDSLSVPLLDQVSPFTEDKLGNIWLGIDYYLVKFDGENWHKTYWDKHIREIEVDSYNNLWMLIEDQGLEKFDGENSTFYTEDDEGTPLYYITNILIDAQDNVWIATDEHGLFKLANENFSNYNINNSNIARNYVKDMVLDKNQNIWINTYRGVQVFNEEGIVTFVSQNRTSPSTYYLEQNYPNPFNPSTKISFSIPEKSNVQLKIFDILGREISTLMNEEKAAGSYEVEFNASKLASGLYFYQLKSGNFIETRKMMLLK